MKTNCSIILIVMLAIGAIAQNNTNVPPPQPLPPIPAPVTSPTAEIAPAPETTNASAKKTPAHHKKKRQMLSAAKASAVPFTEPTVTLAPGAAQVAVNNLNIRSQAGLNGEVVTRLAKGDAVTVLSQINLDKHKPGEPAQWAKISCPTNASVWVRSSFIDASKTVTPKKLNLRAGPSEDYGILGVIERGTVISEIITKGDWTQIEVPTNAYAFVAAVYLKQEASGNLATNVPPSTETQPTPMVMPVPEPQPIVTEATNTPPAPDTNAPAAPDTNSPTPAMIGTNTPAEVDTNLPPPPPRIVTHEGTVRPVNSIIEPTDYELFDPKTGVPVDYLYTTTTNLDLGRYNGLHIIVTGEEGMAKRWKDTPVLTIQRIQVVE
jgi:uncharacterized protein YgiM (DUF1202 family)